MTAIPPRKTHRITIVVRGPREEKHVKAYMSAIRKAVGRISRISQTPKPKAKSKGRRRRRGRR
jgi:hypothetical protein